MEMTATMETKQQRRRHTDGDNSNDQDVVDRIKKNNNQLAERDNTHINIEHQVLPFVYVQFNASNKINHINNLKNRNIIEKTK